MSGGLLEIVVGASRGTQQTISISNISAPTNWPLQFVVVCLSLPLSIKTCSYDCKEDLNSTNLNIKFSTVEKNGEEH